MLSDGLTEMKVAMATLESKQEQCRTGIDKMETKIDVVSEKISTNVKSLEDDFLKCRTSGVGRQSEVSERFRWQERMQKVILSLVIFTIALIFTLHFGIGFPLP